MDQLPAMRRTIILTILPLLVGMCCFGQRLKHDPDTFACASTWFSLDEFEKEPSVISPDGRTRVQLDKNDYSFRVLVGGKEIGRLHYGDISANIEIAWSPDSQQFFISYSDGGAIGNYSVHLFSIKKQRLVKSAAPTVAYRDFKSQHYCRSRGNNIFFLDWTPDSKNVFFVTEVYPTGDCGKEMSKFRGYLVDARTGTIIERFGEKKTTAIEERCRETGTLSIEARK